MLKPKVKICGIFNEIDVFFINEAEPDYTGFVFYEKSHRYINDIKAQSFRKKISNKIKTVGVFVNDDVNHILDLYQSDTISIIQLHGDEDESYIEKIRKSIPDAQIWQAFKIKSEEDVFLAKKSSANLILLDNGKGTGNCFDWETIGRIDRKFILAGGLDINNIERAINKVKPYIVDISSGVETLKQKDRDKIIEIVKAVKKI